MRSLLNPSVQNFLLNLKEQPSLVSSELIRDREIEEIERQKAQICKLFINQSPIQIYELVGIDMVAGTMELRNTDVDELNTTIRIPAGNFGREILGKWNGVSHLLAGLSDGQEVFVIKVFD